MKYKRTRLFILLGILAISIAMALLVIPFRLIQPNYGIVSFNRGQTIVVEIAETPAQQEQGLSGREEIGSEFGLLFVYPREGVKAYWMKDMNFPIDIIWINDGYIVGFDENLPPAVNLVIAPHYYSPVPVDAVLEVQSGFVEKNSLQIGQKVMINTDSSQQDANLDGI